MEKSSSLTGKRYRTFAQALLELFALRGIEVVFANLGTDLTAIVEAFALQKEEGRDFPRYVLVPHEQVLAAMAYGFFLKKEKPAVSIVHAGVGTANTLGIMMTAYKNRIPLILIAGAMPEREKGDISKFSFIHWSSDLLDQGGLVRPFVKWCFELKFPEQIEEVFDRAYGIAMTEPKGPVYLIIPPEVMLSSEQEFDFRDAPLFSLPESYPDLEKIDEVADLIRKAEFPLLITSSLGRDPQAVSNLLKLTEIASFGVVSFVPEFMNFPLKSEFHLGFSPDRFLSMADLIIVADSDVPWIPSRKSPSSAKIVQIGVDPLFPHMPVRGFPSHITIKGETSYVLLKLCERLSSLPPDRSKIDKRKRFIKDLHDQIFEEFLELSKRVSKKRPLHPAYVSSSLCDLLDEDTVLVNEYDNRIPPYLNLKPGHYFCSPHFGYLGWAFGCALGIKMACPEKQVVLTIGDGSYFFSVPSVCHFVAKEYNLPILILLYNNRGYDAVRRATRLLHPNGIASRKNFFPLCEFIYDVKFELIPFAFDGYGERIDDPERLIPAIAKAKDMVKKEGKLVLLNIICD